MGYINNVQQALKEVYTPKKYFFISFGAALAFFLSHTIVSNYSILFSNRSFLLFFSLLKGTVSAMTTVSFVLLVIMSFLAGIVTAMTVFLIKRQLKGSLEVGSSGILVSSMAPTCPSCATGLLSMLGVGGFLTVLPFNGAEFGFLAAGLLGASIIYMSNKITTKTCSIISKEI